MKNRVITALFAMFAVTLLASFSIAQAETSNGGDDSSSVASAPAVTTVSVTTSNGSDDGVSITSGAGTTGSTVSNGSDDGASNGTSDGSNTTSTTVSNGSDDGVSTGSNNGSNGSSSTVTNGDDDAAGSANPGGPSNPGNPGNPGGPGSGTNSGTSGGGLSGGSNGGFGVPNAPQVLGAEVTSCPLISSFMKLGWNNNGADVAKLQAFLKSYEGLDVAVTGTFDQKTDAAVRAFQKKYLVDVMGPWDATRPSGIVYITTSKKINELACKYPLTLSAAEIAIINAYKHAQNGDATGAAIGSDNGSASSTATVTINGQDDASQNDNIAAVGGSSIFSRFWAFIVSLFQ